jgi:hypothetical protein
MIDNLRGDNNSPFFQDDEQGTFSGDSNSALPSIKMPGGTFLGLTALQRFILAMMLLMVICIVGSMLLLVTGSFYLPFFS